MHSRGDSQHVAQMVIRSADDTGQLSLPDERSIAAATGVSLVDVELIALAEGILPRRYQQNIGTIGLQGQTRLLRAGAAVVGLGGLGGHVVQTVARLGVGHIVGIDPDRFEETNLNRQSLAGVGDLGVRKTAKAEQHVAQINPAVRFTACASALENVPDGAVARCTVVFGCLDSGQARLALAAKCRRLGLPLIDGAIAGWSGQVAACRSRSDVLSKLYGGTDQGLERDLGNPPFTAATAANVMVARAMPILLGQAEEGTDQIVFFDLEHGEWEQVDL